MLIENNDFRNLHSRYSDKNLQRCQQVSLSCCVTSWLCFCQKPACNTFISQHWWALIQWFCQKLYKWQLSKRSFHKHISEETFWTHVQTLFDTKRLKWKQARLPWYQSQNSTHSILSSKSKSTQRDATEPGWDVEHPKQSMWGEKRKLARAGRSDVLAPSVNE